MPSGALFHSELERMDYLEFIARVTLHIPDKGQVMIRYYGLYANAHGGKMSKVGVSPFPSPNGQAGTLDGSRRERGIFLSWIGKPLFYLI